MAGSAVESSEAEEEGTVEGSTEDRKEVTAPGSGKSHNL